MGLKRLVGTAIVLVMGLTMISAGSFAMTLGPEQMETGQQRIENATEVEAEIVNTDLRYRGVVDEDDEDDIDSYRVYVEFVYEFQNESYRSGNITPMTTSREYHERSQARAFLDRYPVGTNVTAYVDPAHPDEGFLRTETHGSKSVFRTIGGLAVAMGALFLFLGLGGLTGVIDRS